MTQALSGHRSFAIFTHWLQKTTNECIYCGDIDTPEHTLFKCTSAEEDQREAELLIDEQLTKDNPVEVMMRSPEAWSIISRIIIQSEALSDARNDLKKRDKYLPHLATL
ncbi:hypothetical protein ABEB36_004395 [Hypothenemus hampei]|uniref:Reverse transcriptase n=1 Tax=Hypothenemus hampei TaxID=57062 RepID=A0ABD1F362_HYPHA